MKRDGQEDLLRYYWRELTYLRRMGAAFAEQHPKIAGRLELGAGESPDPHVERLLEAFAFLTGRIQHNLDGDFPEVAAELLNLLYPHYLTPVPSMAVARFEADPAEGKLTTGLELPRHLPVFAEAKDARGLVCRFRTCYPVVLWPLAVAEAAFEATARYDFLDRHPRAVTLLRLRLERQGQTSLADVALDRLRFYLNGDRMLCDQLYELLFCHCLGVALLPEGEEPPVLLPAGALAPVGFGAGEEVLPHPASVHPGYRLLQEYFTFPQKFLFFDVGHLEGHGSETFFDLLFLLDQPPRDRLPLGRDTFALGCAPIVNLFPRTTEPVRLDHRQTEYRLVADARRERTTGIHSVLAVSGTLDPRDESRRLAPFYSFDHGMAAGRQRAFWHARRVPTGRQDLPGTDILLSLLDLDFRPSLPALETLYAHTLCTNRDLAERLPPDAILQTDAAALQRIVCLGKTTPEIVPPLGGQALWRLISHLSLNYLSLAGGPESRDALREIVRLYSHGSPSAEQQIHGIEELSHRRVVRRMGGEAWRGFCRGSEITVTFDEDAYVGASAFLLASVLNHFFALYASINSFTRMVARSRQREGVWKEWPPMAGRRLVL